jgi:hypothetical protein
LEATFKSQRVGKSADVSVLAGVPETVFSRLQSQ